MLFYFLYRFGQFIALHLPLRFAYAFAVFASDLHGFFADQDRIQVTENLKVIFPERSDREIKRIRIKMYRNFAKYLVDFFRFQNVDRDYINKKIRLENIDYFNQALKHGKGVVVLTAHIGNWELGGIVIALLGFSFWAVALTHKDSRVNRFFNHQRESKGVKVIPLENAVRMSLSALRHREMLALLGDRDFTEGGLEIDFLGKKTLIPDGPAILSLKTEAPIVPGFMLRNADDTWTLKIEKPIYPESSGNGKQDVLNLINSYKVIIEDYIRKYPDQWYMFKRFWRNA
jgi:KDO2-lipid IV(A) lauroyltransferase